MKNIYICLENIRSLYNVGAVFRTCSFFSFYDVILLGYSGKIKEGNQKVLNKKVNKTALGTQKHLNIIFLDNSEDLLCFAQKNKLQIIAIEQHKNSKNINNWEPADNQVIVLGNEKTGISKNILEQASEIIEIPRSGKHNSLNVEVTAGIVLQKIKNHSN